MKTWKLFAGLAVLAACAFAQQDDSMVFLPKVEKQRIPIKNFFDADTNHNGQVTLEEFMAQRIRWAEQTKTPVDEEQVKKIFLNKDTNRTGELTPEEYRLR